MIASLSVESSPSAASAYSQYEEDFSSMRLTEKTLASLEPFPVKADGLSDTSTTCSHDDLVNTVSRGTEDDGQPCWTKSRLLRLATELLEGYNEPQFQEQLKVLLANAPNARDVPGRMELALTVQSKVLPKYGFQPTPEGIDAMMKIFSQFMIDWMVEKLVNDIEKTLGLPQGATIEAVCGPRHMPDPIAIGADAPVKPAVEMRTQSMSKAQAKPSLSECEISTTLSKAKVIDLLGELLQKYSSSSFQHQLEELLFEAGVEEALDVPGRKELVLKVQSKVLPKYGLPGTGFGAMLMIDSVSPFIDDCSVNYLVAEMDAKLGLPKDTTASICRCDFARDERQSPPEESGSVQLTRQQVLALASELLDGFRAPDFQQALQKLLDDSKSKFEVPGRAELALTVQSKVLPKYKIPATAMGVINMMELIAPFAGDWMIGRLVNDIDECLGLPRETTLTALASMGA
jgi:hypothetical protein